MNPLTPKGAKNKILRLQYLSRPLQQVVEQEKRRRLEPLLGGQECNRDIGVQTLPRYSVQLYQIGATSITVSDDPQAILQPEVGTKHLLRSNIAHWYAQTRARFGLIINCTETEIWESLAKTLKQGCIDYLHVPLPVCFSTLYRNTAS